MNRKLWNHAVLCATLAMGSATFLLAQNATSGGDQQAQPDAQQGGGQDQHGQGQHGAGGATGGRRGGGIRGTVTAVSGASITLKNEQGETWTIVTTDNTRVRRDGQPGTVAAVQNGDEVMAMGMPDADKHEVHAMMVMDVSAAEVAKARANLGKTYIVGRITANNKTQLTILRSDRVPQVISLDESTSLHKGGRMDPQAMQAAGLDMGMMGGGMMGGGMGNGGGMGGGRRGGNADNATPNEQGEAITLADVKVGDTVVGIGGLKGNSFVPTDLRVQERPAGGGGRRGPGGGTNDAPPPQQ